MGRQFSGSATGRDSGTTNVFDADPSVVWLGAIPATSVSKSSWLGLVLSIRRGTQPADPIDTLANGIPNRLNLQTRIGYPNSCPAAIPDSSPCRWRQQQWDHGAGWMGDADRRITA